MVAFHLCQNNKSFITYYKQYKVNINEKQTCELLVYLKRCPIPANESLTACVTQGLHNLYPITIAE